MEPFFFGADDRRQLGLYHPPVGLPRDEGVVICPPLFAEYLRCHACLRRVALSAAGAGMPVLRFDYYGTGDSAGTFDETTPHDWRSSVLAAVAEIRELSGVNRVQLIGVRAGATLAAQVATDSPEIAGLVLWDPIMDGGAYVSQLEQTHRRLLAAHGLNAADRSESEFVGFRVSQRMLDELRGFSFPDLQTLNPSAARPIKLVLSSEDDGYQAIANGAGTSVAVQRLDFDCDWSTHSEALLFPPGIIAALTNSETE